MTNDDLPALLHTLEAAAAQNQQRFFWSQKIELASLALSATAFEVGWTRNDIRFGGLLGALLLAGALLSRLWRDRAQYEELWSQTRADAESVKSLAWQYSVAGGEFPSSPDESSALTRLGQSLETLAPPPSHSQTAASDRPTQKMREVRSSSFAERRLAYLEDRLLDQQGWYDKEAAKNKRRASQWGTLIMAAEGLGLLLALGYGIGLLDLNLSGLLGAATAAAFAWQQARRYRFLAVTYGSMSHQIDEAIGRAQSPDAEDRWDEIVAGAEDLLCRENRRWTDDRVLR